MRAELLKITGVLEVTYHPGADRFAVRYESVLVGLEKILATVSLAGAMMGKTYVPEVVPPASDWRS